MTPEKTPSLGGTILVTGATGFIGEHLLRMLASHGDTVIGVGWTRTVWLPSPSAKLVRADLSEPAAVRQLLTQAPPTVVFHCAAMTNVAECQSNPAAAEQHIVGATSVLANELQRLRPAPLLIAVSTDLVFDGEHAPYRETDPTQPISVYGQLKQRAELAVLAYPQGTVARTALTYGAPMTHKSSFIGWMAGELTAGRELTLFQDEVRTPIWVDDLCRVLIRLAADRLTGLWHVGGPERLNRVEIGEQFCAVTGLPRDLIRKRRLADSTYPAPRVRDVSLDSDKLRRRLDPTIHTFEQALRIIRSTEPQPI
jgi:dTDP-4-dehydrorhamnose reductase